LKRRAKQDRYYGVGLANIGYAPLLAGGCCWMAVGRLAALVAAGGDPYKLSEELRGLSECTHPGRYGNGNHPAWCR
jgi:hypothetical protein